MVRFLSDILYEFESDFFDKHDVSEDDEMSDEKIVIEESRPEQLELISRYEYYYSRIKYGSRNKEICAKAILLFITTVCISIAVMMYTNLPILVKISSILIPISIPFIYGAIFDNRYNSNKHLINKDSKELYTDIYQKWKCARYCIDVSAGIENPFGESNRRVMCSELGRHYIYIPYITWRDYVDVACKVYEIADRYPCKWSISLKVEVNIRLLRS